MRSQMRESLVKCFPVSGVRPREGLQCLHEPATQMTPPCGEGWGSKLWGEIVRSRFLVETIFCQSLITVLPVYYEKVLNVLYFLKPVLKSIQIRNGISYLQVQGFLFIVELNARTHTHAHTHNARKSSLNLNLDKKDSLIIINLAFNLKKNWDLLS